MTYADLGYTDTLEEYRKEQKLDSFDVGRVLAEHKERYVVKTPIKEYDSELIGNLRFTAESRYDFPAVGDWVAFSEYDQGKALIHAVYPRSSIIERQAVGKKGQVQIIATNIDFGLIHSTPLNSDGSVNSKRGKGALVNNSTVSNEVNYYGGHGYLEGIEGDSKVKIQYFKHKQNSVISVETTGSSGMNDISSSPASINKVKNQ